MCCFVGQRCLQFSIHEVVKRVSEPGQRIVHQVKGMHLIVDPTACVASLAQDACDFKVCEIAKEMVGPRGKRFLWLKDDQCGVDPMVRVDS